MAVDSVSALSPMMAYTQRTPVNRTEGPGQQSALANSRASEQASAQPSAVQASAPRTVQRDETETRAELSGPEASGNWNWAAAQPGVRASPAETEGSIQNASSEIARAYGTGQVSASDIRNASEAYRNEASARDQAAQQQQGSGTRTLDIFA